MSDVLTALCWTQITEELRLEGICRECLVQPCGSEQGQPEQVAQAMDGDYSL